ncbi:MAG: PilW family protein [Candidatus Aminicenantes bacterium]|nr:PilW family protein [Candidatus Aminicenantes bacterium]
MKKPGKRLRNFFEVLYKRKRSGFTMVEFLIGSSIMVAVILGAMSLYVTSNKLTVDHRQYAELQNNVRAAMYFLTRDIRSAGSGLTLDIAGYFLEGQDSFSTGPPTGDYIKVLGNFDDIVSLRIEDYQGASSQASLYDQEVKHSPYPCPEFFEGKIWLFISTKCPGCFAYRYIDPGHFQGCDTGNAHFEFSHGQNPAVNPPGGLSDTGCDSDCFDDAIITIGDIRQYWLDTTGNPGDYPNLNLVTGSDGYLGEKGVLYVTTYSNQAGSQIVHMPLARNIETMQFRYNGDFDGDGTLDGFQEWDNANWTILGTEDNAAKEAKLAIISAIRQVRVWVVGRTPRKFVSVHGTPADNSHLYRRPGVANSNAATEDDMHRRFVLTSVVNIRNMSLNLYNLGVR